MSFLIVYDHRSLVGFVRVETYLPCSYVVFQLEGVAILSLVMVGNGQVMATRAIKW